MKTHINFAAAASALVLSAALASAQGVLTPGIARPTTSLVPATTAATDVSAGVALPKIPVGNHYVCYPVKAAQFKPRTVQFQDQFGLWTVQVVGITRVCTPALKRVAGAAFKIVDRNLHLTCYAIRYQGGHLPPVMTNDQFGPQKLMLSPATEVCLPAGKIIIK